MLRLFLSHLSLFKLSKCDVSLRAEKNGQMFAATL